MKKIICSLAFAVVASTTQAAYLYWQVSNDQEIIDQLGPNVESIVGATVYATNGSQTMEVSSMPTTRTEPEGILLDNLGIFENGDWSFYIELKGYDEVAYGKGIVGDIGHSKEQTYAELASSNYIVPISGAPSLGAWHGTAYVAPEPTSAMLMMMGLALLSLKRRKE